VSTTAGRMAFGTTVSRQDREPNRPTAAEAPDLVGGGLNGAPPTSPAKTGEILSVVDPMRPLSPGVLAARRRTSDRNGEATFRLRQEWVGRVEEVSDEFFRAVLMTRDRPGEQEEAEIWLDEVSPVDLDLVRPGAIFYWVIGYRDEAYGQRRSVSSFRFRRLLPLNDEDQRRAHESAEALWDWATTSSLDGPA
jgi:hypothetical protein